MAYCGRYSICNWGLHCSGLLWLKCEIWFTPHDVVPPLCFLQCTAATVLLLPAPVSSPAAPLAPAAMQTAGWGIRGGFRGWGLWCVWEVSVPDSLSLVLDTPPWAPVASAGAWGWTDMNGYSQWPEEHARSWGAKNTERRQEKNRKLVTSTRPSTPPTYTSSVSIYLLMSLLCCWV